MVDLKSIHPRAIPAALAKAERYRLLNDPQNTESICRDVLRVDPENQQALVLILLALTDQFGKNMRVSVNHAHEILPRLTDAYQRAYYEGVVCERWARSLLEQGAPGFALYEWFTRALAHFEHAEKLSPPDNDDAILRWNACARIMKRHGEIQPKPQDQSIEGGFEDEVPFR